MYGGRGWLHDGKGKDNPTNIAPRLPGFVWDAKKQVTGQWTGDIQPVLVLSEAVLVLGLL